MGLLRYFHPVFSAKKLGKKPVSVQVGSEKVVLFRNHEGKASALLDRCPHRFTPLSAGSVTADGLLQCPYHGWSFNESGKGHRPGQDKDQYSCRVASYQVVEKYNYLWIGDRTADPKGIPEHVQDGWVFADSYSFEFEAPFHVVLDNFSEDEHFPFVHKMFGWDETQVNDVEFTCQKRDDQIDVHYWGPQRKFFGMSLMLTKPGQYLDNQWTQRYDPVNFTYTAHMTDKNKAPASPGYTRVAVYFVPRGENKTDLHVFQFLKFRSKIWYKLMPLIKPTYVGIVKKDFKNDALLTEKLKDVPSSLKGMALTQYDEPLRYSRELLDQIYFRRELVENARKPTPADVTCQN